MRVTRTPRPGSTAGTSATRHCSGTVEGAYAELLSEFRSVHAVQWARRDRHLMKSTSMRIKTDKDLLELWNEIDADGSGSLDMQEVQRLSHRLHMPLTHSELRDAMKQMDADGSGEVDFEEFQAWFEASKASGSNFSKMISEAARLRWNDEGLPRKWKGPQWLGGYTSNEAPPRSEGRPRSPGSPRST